MRRIAILAGALLAGCGDGPTDPGPAEGDVLVVAPGSLLFAAAGEQQQLRAYSVDADGDSTAVAATFESSNSAVVSVTGGGAATGGATLGSAQIVARSGTLVSAPVLALRATPVAGALLVADSQVVRPIEAVDPGAPYEPGWRYRIGLRGVAPSVGQIMLATGAAPIAGRVVSVSGSGAEVTVELEFRPLNELFASLSVNETLKLGGVEPLPAPAQLRGNLSARTADVEFDLGSFQCTAKGEASQEGFTLDAGPITVDPDFSLDVAATAEGGVERLVGYGSVRVSGSAKPRIGGNISGEVDCHGIIGTVPFPILGVLSFVVGGGLPVGAGFTISVKATSASVGADLTLAAQSSIRAGFDCQGECTPIFDLQTTADGSSAKPVLPASLADAAKVELAVSAYGRVEFAIGPGFFRALQFSPLEMKLGLTQSFDLASRNFQGADPAYASSFQLKPLVYGGTTSALAEAAGLLGEQLPDAKFEPDLDPLARSPSGTLVITPPAVAPGSGTAPGQSATFTVTLTGATYLGAYAVEGVEIRWQRPSGAGVTLEPGRPGCTDVEAAEDQLVFSCQAQFTEEHIGQQTFFAFVRTRIFGIPIPFPLEVAVDGRAAVTVSNAPGVVQLSPAGVTLAPGAVQVFTASGSATEGGVVWQATGGTFTTAGNVLTYTAGQTAGAYQVVATSVSDPTRSATAPVTVTQATSTVPTMLSAFFFAQSNSGSANCYQEFAAPQGTVPDAIDETRSCTSQNPTDPNASASASASMKHTLSYTGGRLSGITVRSTSTVLAAGGGASTFLPFTMRFRITTGSVRFRLTGSIEASGPSTRETKNGGGAVTLFRADGLSFVRQIVGALSGGDLGPPQATLDSEGVLGPGEYVFQVHLQSHAFNDLQPVDAGSGAAQVELTLMPE